MERRIEHRNLRNAFHCGLTRPDSDDVRRIMERSEGHAFLDRFHNLVVDYYGFMESFAAMYDPVPDRRDVIQTVYYAVFFIGQRPDNLRDGRVVILQLYLKDLGILSRHGLLDKGIVNPDPVAQSFRKNIFILRINQLIF